MIILTVQLSQKEKTLLQDQVKHEEICIQKYNNYANQAQCQELKQLFQQYAKQEEEHKNSINQLLNGQIPQMSQQQNQQSSYQTTGIQTQQSGLYSGQHGGQLSGQLGKQFSQQVSGQGTMSSMQDAMGNANDAALCNDMLMTEKFVSSSYDNAIFQFNDTNVRQVLNHIQKEEQQHGEGIKQYMQKNNLS